MKKLLLALFGICCGVSLFAATGSTTPQGWYDDFAAAQKEAKKTNRPMLLLFTGSDWCPYCVKLKKNVLDTAEFKKLAAEKLILVYLDFPSRVKLPAELQVQNRELAKKYQVDGFPGTVVLDPSGKARGEVWGYQPDYIKSVEAILDLIK